MTKGTVAPVCVVVVATSPGGLFGSYGCIPPSVDDLYSYSYVAGLPHFGFFDSLLQTHGWTCGPDSTGPPLAWFTIVTFAPRRLPLRPRSVARRTVRPTRRPVTSPSTCPFWRTAKRRVTLRLPALTRSRDGLAPRGREIATSA